MPLPLDQDFEMSNQMVIKCYCGAELIAAERPNGAYVISDGPALAQWLIDHEHADDVLAGDSPDHFMMEYQDGLREKP